MSSLPETVIFSVKDAETETVRYLSITGPQRLLRCGAEDGVFSVTSKFAVEPAANGLVHIRSCYDNHYWVRASNSMMWLSATGAEAVTDKTKDECTLFRPQMGAGNVWVSFVHLRSGLNVALRPASDPYAYNLGLAQSAPTQFSFIDYASLLKLPRYVVFKYVSSVTGYTSYLTPDGYKRYQKYGSKEPDDLSTRYETFVTRSGDVRFKVSYDGTFWISVREDSMKPTLSILGNYSADSDPNYYPHTIFQLLAPSPPDNTKVVIRCRGYEDNNSNNYYFQTQLEPLEGNYYTLCAKPANGSDPQDPSKVGITVLYGGDRSMGRVTVTEFRKHRAISTTRTPSQQLDISSTYEFDNPSEHDIQESITPPPTSNTTIVNYTFSSSVNLTISSAYFNSQMPYVSEQGQVEFPEKLVSLGYKAWGQSYDYVNTSSAPSPVPITVTVPAKSRVKATLLASRATYEFPFSYEILDHFLPTGEGDSYNLHDGVFTVRYNYSYKVRTDQVQPLAPASTTQD